MRDAVGRCREIEKPTLFGFPDPLIAVAVAAEDDALVLSYDAADKLVQIVFKIGRALERIGVLAQRLGDCGVDDDICTGDGRR